MDRASPDLLPGTRHWRSNRQRLSAPGFRTFLAISDVLELSEKARRHMLGSLSQSTYRNWRRRALAHEPLCFSVDILTRISAVLCVYGCLENLFTSGPERASWLKTPHHARIFEGRPPISFMASQEGLLLVLRFLKSAQTGIYMEPNAIDRDYKPLTDRDIVIHKQRRESL